MHQPINQVRLRGFLTEPARLFVSRSGQPRLTFRLEVWIDDQSLPPKKPAGVDYFSVVAFGSQFVGLATDLVRGREVSVAGRLRSRDLDTATQQVVTEVVAQEITVLETRAQAQRERSWRMILN
jgi:single-stranded DNA-binding protein